ncbi:metal ABC transporter solute-binding protein, Zn/Mn family [Campylobacter vulpis]|uniref:Cation ABC transporter substrate-binding protein n=1 Tax=Campylobacter vulpis TaxID=1655500 RepID=A0A2G4R4D4_9BACT|nr:zinc ABC transporter substrate-binding protein [Campylobacter vulpis]MBS4241671.1 cation ABC transporter substrate-binding protein [Campylobacter vulpis]MBS4252886.1 cation ABC transporter substrate-binding protein [Campylobacter vulpis]MBS4276171.1 cation ABC transporter substrate-binding protein [Campylobacter vulpis]MBS4282173.1 cation ABC transporter substrate-binding protein [Campylobacter vulpis]MBS4307587.1 cation ABC transporter substrate-binding protein [Campylobacter vulpis]
MKILLFLLLNLSFLVAKPVASVSIAPQEFFVKKIAGDSVEINTLLPQNSDEHTFEFKTSHLSKLEKSDLYFTMGLEFEKVFLDKFKRNFPNLSIVNTQKNIHFLEFEEEHEHHDHDHAKDIHTWLDPILVKTLATNIATALKEKYPQNAKMYENNLQNFHKELEDLNLQINEELKGVKNRKFIVYHPSWAYFAKRYRLEQIPVEIAGKEPKISDLKRIIKKAREENIKVIFVQPGFPENAAKVLAKECGAKIVMINHLAKDWDKELLKSVEALKKAL